MMSRLKFSLIPIIAVFLLILFSHEAESTIWIPCNDVYECVQKEGFTCHYTGIAWEWTTDVGTEDQNEATSCGDGRDNDCDGKTDKGDWADCCEPDCTLFTDDVCHSECVGYKGCAMSALCDEFPLGEWTCQNKTHAVECCSGPYPKNPVCGSCWNGTCDYPAENVIWCPTDCCEPDCTPTYNKLCFAGCNSTERIVGNETDACLINPWCDVKSMGLICYNDTSNPFSKQCCEGIAPEPNPACGECGDDTCNAPVENVIFCPQDCCEDDCSDVSDEISHATCHGHNGCNFYDLTAKFACDDIPIEGEVVYNTTHILTCAEGEPRSSFSFWISGPSALKVGEPTEFLLYIENTGYDEGSYDSYREDSYDINYTQVFENPSLVHVSDVPSSTEGVDFGEKRSIPIEITLLATEARGFVNFKVSSRNYPTIYRVAMLQIMETGLPHDLPEFGVLGLVELIAMTGIIFLLSRSSKRLW